ncbi:MAG: hypothetical protein M1339_03525 [Bacteroidetes bacterium]|nr:hypothetical protein [Bacteroidota bacterium]
MKCANCGHRSAEKLDRCPRCGNEIVTSAYCGNCGNALDSDGYLYCPACGAVNPTSDSDHPPTCETHLDNEAIAYCVTCGKAVCKECAESDDNKFLCNDSTHRIYLENWEVLHTFDFEYEAAMLYVNLDQQGIESQVFTKVNPDITESSLRPTIVEVRVPAKRLDEARNVVDMLGLGNEEMEEDE